jgi:hypothetical protein
MSSLSVKLSNSSSYWFNWACAHPYADCQGRALWEGTAYCTNSSHYHCQLPGMSLLSWCEPVATHYWWQLQPSGICQGCSFFSLCIIEIARTCTLTMFLLLSLNLQNFVYFSQVKVGCCYVWLVLWVRLVFAVGFLQLSPVLEYLYPCMQVMAVMTTESFQWFYTKMCLCFLMHLMVLSVRNAHVPNLWALIWDCRLHPTTPFIQD